MSALSLADCKGTEYPQNTLNYRIRKIRELLGDENELGPQRSDIELALDIKNFIEETRFD